MGFIGVTKAALVAAVIGVCACSADEQVTPLVATEDVSTYVGALPGTDAVVAVSIAEDAVVAYVCGGDATFATQTRWFRGVIDATAGIAQLVAADGTRMELTLDLDDDRVAGSVESNGARTAFALEATGDDDVRGLYTTVDEGCRTGVVVMGTAAAPRVQGVWCRAATTESAGIFAQVTPILPVALRAGALRVQVRVADGVPRTLVTERIDPEALR